MKNVMNRFRLRLVKIIITTPSSMYSFLVVNTKIIEEINSIEKYNVEYV